MNSVKNVALITPSWPTGSLSNGIVTYTENMYKGFKEIGLGCSVLTSQGKDENNPDVYQIINNNSSLLSKVGNKTRKLLRLRHGNEFRLGKAIIETVNKLPKAQQPSIIEQEESFGFSYNTQQCTKIPVITRLHGPYFLHGELDNCSVDSGYLSRLENEKNAILYTAGVSSPSNDVLQKTLNFYNLKLNHAVVIPNPIAIPDDREVWRYEACDPNQLLFVGRFDNRKGGDLVLDALAQLTKINPNLILNFVGSDVGYSDQYGKQWSIQDYVKENYPHMVGQKNIRIHGRLTPDKIVKFRRQSFVTIIASRYDNFPYTVMEALSFGVPIVASNVGGIPEIVKDNFSGLLFNAGDVNSLVRNIANLLDNHPFAIKLGNNARSDAKTRYSVASIASQMKDFYQESLARYCARRS